MSNVSFCASLAIVRLLLNPYHLMLKSKKFLRLIEAKGGVEIQLISSKTNHNKQNTFGIVTFSLTWDIALKSKRNQKVLQIFQFPMALKTF